MKVSIITVCYNSAEYLSSAIDSVRAQSHADIEYIVIDGCSTDGTSTILELYSDDIAHVVSEPDKGIYDAMNKGMKLATGDVIGILNSDDYFAHENVIATIANAFKNHDVESCHGDELVIDKNGKVLRYCSSMDDTDKLFKKGRHPHHGTFFVKNEIYKKYGYFDEVFKRDKVELLQKSDIFVLPSYYKSEAFPISIIEAMACGNAIVTTDYKYLPEVVNEKNGVLVEIKSVESLAKGIESLLNNIEKLRKVQKFNKIEAQNKYSLNQYLKNLNEIVMEK